MTPTQAQALVEQVRIALHSGNLPSPIKIPALQALDQLSAFIQEQEKSVRVKVLLEVKSRVQRSNAEWVGEWADAEIKKIEEAKK